MMKFALLSSLIKNVEIFWIPKDSSTDKSHGVCKQCQCKLKYSVHITNLVVHLKKKHSIDSHASSGVTVSDVGLALTSFFLQNLNNSSIFLKPNIFFVSSRLKGHQRLFRLTDKNNCWTTCLLNIGPFARCWTPLCLSNVIGHFVPQDSLSYKTQQPLRLI
ncbi:hypothetical protein ATANTOWER_014800 [Ataeniobius toweri]|uniref:BED-type domain-containing protein n=1 Tax=Ataeniobius toweri TaxID=208326 RepID=A0ABU7AFM6_9TELE|nr:hypothetical protein [Ataeniobius toweri]